MRITVKRVWSPAREMAAMKTELPLAGVERNTGQEWLTFVVSEKGGDVAKDFCECWQGGYL
jgi:hypothetical protein